jgi:hypothetical protein
MVMLGLGLIGVLARTYEIHPAMTAEDEEFERVANVLKPGDELVLHGGVYAQTGRRGVTAKGTPELPIVIRAVPGQAPLLNRPVDDRDRYNKIEFVDCAHLVIRGLRNNYVHGRMVGIAVDDCQCFDGGTPAFAWGMQRAMISGPGRDHRCWARRMPLLLRRSISTPENAAAPLTWVPMKPRGNRRIRVEPFSPASNGNREALLRA